MVVISLEIFLFQGSYPRKMTVPPDLFQQGRRRGAFWGLDVWSRYASKVRAAARTCWHRYPIDPDEHPGTRIN